MGRKKVEAVSVTLTGQRAARLFRLLSLLGNGAQTRQQLLRRLKIDVRGFYRDLEALRGLSIEVNAGDDNRYTLTGGLDDALARLPFPDPGLNFRDVQQLAKGDTAAHRKLKQRINSFLGGNSKHTNPSKPRYAVPGFLIWNGLVWAQAVENLNGSSRSATPQAAANS